MGQFDLSSYIDTQARINRFWAETNAQEQQGFIKTEILTDPDNDTFVTVRARVGYYEGVEEVVTATGIASEVRTYMSERMIDGQKNPGHNRVNETSWVENCETSAIGRAFANLGYATTGEDRPSREEMEKVNRYESQGPSVREATTSPSPAPRPQGGGGGGYRQPAPRTGQTPSIQNPTAAPTDKQISLITDMAKGNHEAIAFAMFEKEFSQINRQEASDMIGELMATRPPKKQSEDTIIVDEAPPMEEPDFDF